MFIVVCGIPGAGKTTFIREFMKGRDACSFHVPDILKPEGRYRDLLTDEERAFIDSNWQDTEKEFRKGGIAEFTDGRFSLTSTAVRIADLLEKKHQTVMLDAFPRNTEQAEAFVKAFSGRQVHVYEIRCSRNEDAFSLLRQAGRDKAEGKESVDRISKYLAKIRNYHEKTEPAMEILKKNFPYSVCPVDDQGNVCMPEQKLFNMIGCGGAVRGCDESYVYPLGEKQYKGFWKNISMQKYPLMATITLGNYCGDRCRGCFNEHLDNGKYMSPSVLDSLLEDLGKGGCLCVKAAGREPTLYPYLDRFVDGCRDNGMLSCVITGGAMISRWEDLFMTGCDHLRVSLNASTAASHDLIHNPRRGMDSFETREEVLSKILGSRRDRGLTTGITYLDRKENKGELRAFINKWKDDADYIRLASLDYMFGSGLSEELREAKAAGGNIRIHGSFKEKDIERIPDGCLCPALLCRVVIMANGDVAACHKAYELEKAGYPAVYGNLYEQSFREIWNSPKRYEMIRRINADHRKNFEESGIYEQGICLGCKYTNVNQINRWLINHTVRGTRR